MRERDRSVTGVNLIHDEDLLKILYALSDETDDKNYAHEEDNAIGYFFHNCQSPATGLLCWGEHLYWDFLNDNCGYSPDNDFHDASR